LASRRQRTGSGNALSKCKEGGARKVIMTKTAFKSRERVKGNNGEPKVLENVEERERRSERNNQFKGVL
jgi:hypothetical protein